MILLSPQSGRTMEIYTTEPGLQIYTANSYNGFLGNNGVIWNNILLPQILNLNFCSSL